MPTKTFTQGAVVRDGVNYSTALTELEDKINEIKREISYFDAYNITKVVTTPEEFSSQASTLPFGQSLIINTESSFNHNQINYGRGDILLKTNNGELVHIKAQTGGIYYPSKITKNTNSNSYTLEYSYSSAPPTKEESTGKPSDANSNPYITDFSKLIEIGNLTASNTGSIFGNWIDKTDFSADDTTTWITSGENEMIKIQGPSTVKPMIQFFSLHKNEDNEILTMEEVMVEYDLTTYESGWVVTVPNIVNAIKVK